jgi:hypothetical protein
MVYPKGGNFKTYSIILMPQPNTNFTFNGSARLISGADGLPVVRLTDNYSQSGSAFLPNAVDLSNDGSFNTEFQFQITNPEFFGDYDGPGADGLVFVIQTNPDNVGLGGGGLGYQEINNSLGIEFDTYFNGDVDNDGNHVGINLNGSINSVIAQTVPNRLNNGNIWTSWIDYDGTNDLLEVRLSETDQRPDTALLSYTLDLPSVLGTTNAYVGFTSGTGAGTGNHDIVDWNFNDLPAVQVQLNLLADDNGTPGEVITDNRVGRNRSFFVEIRVADLRENAAGINGLGLDLAWDGFILNSINFDPALAITPNFVLSDGSLDYDGLISNLSGGSLPAFELGQSIGVNQLERFALLHFYAENDSNGTSYFSTTVRPGSVALADNNSNYRLDVETLQPIVIGEDVQTDLYYFTYTYGNGDSYSGYGYAAAGSYYTGQTIGYYYNETGNYG